MTNRLPADRMPDPAGHLHRDTGLATVFACLGCSLILLLTGVAVHLGAAGIARHRAEAAADLGALAGAGRALGGSAAACGRAAELVVANGAVVTSCSLTGLDVLLQVQVSVELAGLSGAASARARAGPADDETAR